MECDICQRPFSARRHPFCVSCARAKIFPSRIDQVQALLNREEKHRVVEAVVRPGNDGVIAALPENADWDAITAGINQRSHERAQTEKESADGRLARISEGVKELKEQIEDHKRYIAETKESNQKRREAIALQKHELEKRKAPLLEPVQAAIRKANRHLGKQRNRTAEAREYLCKEVGALCELHRMKDRKGRYEYYLNGLLIPNLKDLNCINGRIRGEKLAKVSGPSATEAHELISASLDNICLFLGICCHYLSTRLPAEIVLPHADFPHAALMQRDTSYKAGDIRYPGLGSSHTSPAQSRILSASVERGKARLPQLDRPLLLLQKQDNKTYGLFLEGVMLLAYDIAWLCRAQGVVEDSPSFDDVCDIGRNIYALAGKDDKDGDGDAPRPSLPKRTTTATTTTATSTAKPSVQPDFGRYSHASAQHSLAGSSGHALFAPDAFKVSLTTLTDRLKAYLRNEAAKSEWDIIDTTEWNDVLEHEQAVMVGGRPVNGKEKGKGPDMSVMTVAEEGEQGGKAPLPGDAPMKGWTKIRGRGGAE